MSDQSGPPFGRASAAAVLDQACHRLDLDPEGAELVRLGENAIYRLQRDPVVVRIARSMDHWSSAEKEVGVAEWLSVAGLRAARTWSTRQPIEVGSHPVTFWHYIDGRRGGPDDVVALARVLRRLHGLPAPTGMDLPSEDILSRVLPRIEGAQVPEPDREFLTALLGELRAAVPRLDFPLAPTVTHGDAHVQNLMVDDSGVVLIDFERVAFGQPEWDLAMTATEFVTARWWTPDQYDAFSESYGFDVTSWSGFDILRRVHEIKMTTWLMQNIDESAEIKEEYERRMQTIRGGPVEQSWRAF